MCNLPFVCSVLVVNGPIRNISGVMGGGTSSTDSANTEPMFAVWCLNPAHSTSELGLPTSGMGVASTHTIAVVQNRPL